MSPDGPSFCIDCGFPLAPVAGKYRMLRVLGEGGFATVYLAEHLDLPEGNRRVVKVLKAELFDEPGVVERFAREIRVTASLSEQHHNIVRVFDDFGRVEGLGYYYVMEHLDGHTLGELLKRDEGVPLGTALQALVQVCDAVGWAHRSGVVHRDLKPDNIMLVTRPGEETFAKVLDFGLARPMEDSEGLTLGFVGTPAYAAPEQILSSDVDHRTDVYSLGVMLFEVLTGLRPFADPGGSDPTGGMALMAHLGRDPAKPTALRSDLSFITDLDQVVLRCLAKDPADRFQDIDQLRERLSSWVALVPADTGLRVGGSGETVRMAPPAELIDPTASTLRSHVDEVGPLHQSDTPRHAGQTPPGETSAKRPPPARGEPSSGTDGRASRSIQLPPAPTSRFVALAVAGIFLGLVLAAVAWQIGKGKGGPAGQGDGQLGAVVDGGATAKRPPDQAPAAVARAVEPSGTRKPPPRVQAVDRRRPTATRPGGPRRRDSRPDTGSAKRRSPSPGPRGRRVFLLVKSVPTRSQVVVGGRVVGTTPYRLVRIRGRSVAFEVKKRGYLASRKRWAARRSDSVVVRLDEDIF